MTWGLPGICVVMRPVPAHRELPMSKTGIYSESRAREGQCARDDSHEFETLKNLHRGEQLGTYSGGVADRLKRAGARGAVAGGDTAAAHVAGCAAAGTKRASESADLDPGSLEAESR